MEGTGCRASASKNIICRLEDCLKERALEDEVQVIATGCFGFCEKGPIVKIMPDNTFYVQVKNRKMPDKSSTNTSLKAAR